MRFPIFWLGAALCTSASAQTPLPNLEISVVDTPGALWIPAATGNFAPANRPIDQPIDRVIIHDIEGTSQAGIDIFARVGAKVSAHYVVSGDGKITQMVRERDVGWHAGNSGINARSVGVELEGFAYRPGFFNLALYETAAKLVRDVTTRHGIPRDREHIIGHAEVPSPRDPTKFGGISGHTDPGPYWNWHIFMSLLRHDARLVSAEIPATIRPGEVVRAAVTFQNSGDEIWAANLAPNPLIGLQASAPVTYLGTSEGAPSSLSSLKGWISPILASGAAADTLPGTSARFEFALTGPRQLGQINEKLRLSLQPTAAQGQTPIFFGEVASLPVQVVPWDIAATPVLASASLPLESVAQWRAPLPLGGRWALYLAPPAPIKRFKTPFRYTVGSGAGAKTFQVESKSGGRGWQFAGWVAVPQNELSLPVALNFAPSGVGAQNGGAVRLVGPFPSDLEASSALEPR